MFTNPAVYELGRLAVTLFFVLSGYLITYLLLQEKKLSGTIAVGAFYMRRVLQIWPLYFLLTGLAFFVFPRIGMMQIPLLTGQLGEHVQFTLPILRCCCPHSRVAGEVRLECAAVRHEPLADDCYRHSCLPLLRAPVPAPQVTV